MRLYFTVVNVVAAALDCIGSGDGGGGGGDGGGGGGDGGGGGGDGDNGGGDGGRGRSILVLSPLAEAWLGFKHQSFAVDYKIYSL